MKEYINKYKFDIIILFAFAVFVTVSFIISFNAGIKIANNFKGFFLEMISFIPLIFILIGLFDVWVPKEKIQKHIGSGSGITGSFWVILLAMLQAGPLYAAFPVAYILYKKGASIRNIFIYLGAFSTLKLPMLAFEAGFLGIKFTIIRTIVSLPVFIIIALIMELFLKNKKFEVKEPSR